MCANRKGIILAHAKGGFSHGPCTGSAAEENGTAPQYSVMWKFKVLHRDIWTLCMRLAWQNGLTRPVRSDACALGCEMGQVGEPAS